MIAAYLGDPIDGISESIDPVLDPATGLVLGVHQVATLGRVRLELQMSVGAPDPRDRIVVHGDPPLDLTIAGGTHGDRATVGTLRNGVRVVQSLPPGLRGALDVAPAFATATSYR